jgi:signal transduction histidine kinase
VRRIPSRSRSALALPGVGGVAVVPAGERRLALRYDDPPGSRAYADGMASRPRRTLRSAGAAIRSVVARGRSRLSWDIVLGVAGVVLFVVSWATVRMTHQVTDAAAPLVAAATVLPLAVARRRAFLGWVVALLVGQVFWALVDPRADVGLPWTVPQVIVLFATMVAVALRERPRLVAFAWAGSVLAMAVVMPESARAGLPLGISAVTLIALLVRWLVLSRRQLAREQEVSDLERARRAVLEERSRIARDLHDVVAHRMSMVVVQAQSAPARLGEMPAPVAEEFLSISEQARAALNEVRGMLGVLRSESTTVAGAPQHGLRDVEALLSQTRDAGVELTWELYGDPSPVGDAVGLVVYRVLQEALANASRHAPGSPVRVRVRCADEVRVEVRSGPAGPGHAPAPETGSPAHGTGLIGMADRARSVGGRIEAGAEGDDFVVRAWLPTTAGASPVPATGFGRS